MGKLMKGIAWGENWEECINSNSSNMKKGYHILKNRTQSELDSNQKLMYDKIEFNKNQSKMIDKLEFSKEITQEEENQLTIGEKIDKRIKELKSKENELETFQELRNSEEMSGFYRLHELDNWLEKQREKEKKLQEIYLGSKRVLDDLEYDEWD